MMFRCFILVALFFQMGAAIAQDGKRVIVSSSFVSPAAFGSVIRPLVESRGWTAEYIESELNWTIEKKFQEGDVFVSMGFDEGPRSCTANLTATVLHQVRYAADLPVYDALDFTGEVILRDGFPARSGKCRKPWTTHGFALEGVFCRCAESVKVVLERFAETLETKAQAPLRSETSGPDHP